jgi:molybdate transport system ATP-binding protein
MSTIALKHAVKKGNFVLDVDTTIPNHGVTGVFGESGSGKTTLLRCIAGLEASKPHDATPVHKRQIGYVFQDAMLFEHLTVRKNIEYGLKRSSNADQSVDEIASLLEISDLLPRSTSGLSGGEAQRVSIARVLCQSPRLILMDEPLSALDERRRNDVLPYLDRLHAESSIPIIYVSHNIDEICRLSDHLLVLDNGKLVAEGELQETLMRVDLPLLAGRNAGAIIEASRENYDDEFDLTRFNFSGGELWAPGRYETDVVRLRISASDVSLSRVASDSSTILNILAAQIVEINTENTATNLVRLKIGNDQLIARITRRSTHQLQLQVGDDVFAQIKSVTVRR